jgi:hypothetical protein
LELFRKVTKELKEKNKVVIVFEKLTELREMKINGIE